jgi:CheY-like chemotaxis protein
MILAGRPARILLIDTNVYFSKRLSDALKREGFEVNASTQPAFALTTLEYDAPTAIVCSTNMREMGALDIARMIRADAKNAAVPVIALGDGSQRALMEAFQAGCDDYIDRTRPPAVIATHIKNIIISKAEGFQPTQMLAQADTSLSGSLTHHDLPGVMQMLGHAHQTGALHINSGETDALLFFDAGAITHAECGSLFGDEAVIHILKNCFKNNSGVYKFVYGSASTQRTVLRSATDLMLDAMREVDESSQKEPDVDLVAVAPVASSPAAASATHPGEIEYSTDNRASTSAEHSFLEPRFDDCSAASESSEDCSVQATTADQFAPTSSIDPSALAPSTGHSDSVSSDESARDNHFDDSAAIESLLDRYAATSSFRGSDLTEQNENSAELCSDNIATSPHPNDYSGTPQLGRDPAAAPFADDSEPVFSFEPSAATPSFDGFEELSPLVSSTVSPPDNCSAFKVSENTPDMAASQQQAVVKPLSDDPANPSDKESQ